MSKLRFTFENETPKSKPEVIPDFFTVSVPDGQIKYEQLKKVKDYTEVNGANTLHGIRFKKENFDGLTAIGKTKGQLLEVAGPTLKGFRLLDVNKLPRKLMVSNKFNGLPYMNVQGGLDRYGARVDLVLDATDTKLPADSQGAVFCAGLCILDADEQGNPKKVAASNQENQEKNKTLRAQVIREAKRILEPGGYLVWQNGTLEDLYYAINLGFSPQDILQYDIVWKSPDTSKKDIKHPRSYDVVFQKV